MSGVVYLPFFTAEKAMGNLVVGFLLALQKRKAYFCRLLLLFCVIIKKEETYKLR